MREREEKLLEIIQAGKATAETTFLVLNKLTGVETEVPGSVISGFLDERNYEIAEKLPPVEVEIPKVTPNPESKRKPKKEEQSEPPLVAPDPGENESSTF